MSLPSSNTGGDSPALLEHPIGTELASTVARWPDREALVGVEQGVRYTWVERVAAVRSPHDIWRRPGLRELPLGAVRPHGQLRDPGLFRGSLARPRRR